MKYKLLEHSSDLKIQVEGKDFYELLKNAAFAVGNLVLPNNNETEEVRELEIHADSEEQLLVKFLNELIYLIQAEYIVCKDFDIKKIDKGIKAICKGKRISPEDDLEYDLKGVTYHELEIKKTQNGYLAQFLIDI